MNTIPDDLFLKSLIFSVYLVFFSAVPALAGLKVVGFLDMSWFWITVFTLAFMPVLYSTMHILASEEISGPMLAGHVSFMMLPIILMLAQDFIMISRMWTGMVILAWLLVLVPGSCLHIMKIHHKFS